MTTPSRYVPVLIDIAGAAADHAILRGIGLPDPRARSRPRELSSCNNMAHATKAEAVKVER